MFPNPLNQQSNVVLVERGKEQWTSNTILGFCIHYFRNSDNVFNLENFIDAVRARIDPIVPVEIGQRTTACCILGNIAYELGRPVDWSPEHQYFANDPEAEKFFHREYENGYKL